MRHCSLRWSRLAVPLGVGGRITTIRARTPDSNGRHLPSSPSPSIRAGIWRCATPRAPRQLPSLTPPNREIQTPEANSRLDKTWGQGHFRLCAVMSLNYVMHEFPKERISFLLESG